MAGCFYFSNSGAAGRIHRCVGYGDGNQMDQRQAQSDGNGHRQHGQAEGRRNTQQADADIRERSSRHRTAATAQNQLEGAKELCAVLLYVLLLCTGRVGCEFKFWFGDGLCSSIQLAAIFLQPLISVKRSMQISAAP